MYICILIASKCGRKDGKLLFGDASQRALVAPLFNAEGAPPPRGRAARMAGWCSWPGRGRTNCAAPRTNYSTRA